MAAGCAAAGVWLFLAVERVEGFGSNPFPKCTNNCNTAVWEECPANCPVARGTLYQRLNEALAGQRTEWKNPANPECGFLPTGLVCGASQRCTTPAVVCDDILP